jgi:hypothetical protein
MILDTSIEKINYFCSLIFFSSFYIHNIKQAARFNKSVIYNAHRKSLEKARKKQKDEKQ